MKLRPTRISSADEAFGLTFFQMSIVKSVEPELKVAVSDDMRAANITANKSPLRPFGKIRITSRG